MRDPRVDPQPGDVLRKGGKDALVIAVRDDRVYCSLGPIDCETWDQTSGVFVSLTQFCEDAKDAAVLILGCGGGND